LKGFCTGAGGVEEEKLNNALRFLQFKILRSWNDLLRFGAGVSADGHLEEYECDLEGVDLKCLYL